MVRSGNTAGAACVWATSSRKALKRRSVLTYCLPRVSLLPQESAQLSGALFPEVSAIRGHQRVGIDDIGDGDIAHGIVDDFGEEDDKSRRSEAHARQVNALPYGAALMTVRDGFLEGAGLDENLCLLYRAFAAGHCLLHLAEAAVDGAAHDIEEHRQDE